MNLSEIVDLVKVESGQYEFDLGELPVSKYKLLLTRKVMPILDKHIPYTLDSSIPVVTSPYTFLTTIPEWVASVKPIGNLSATNVILNQQLRQHPLGDISKGTILWEYNKPSLYVEYSGDFLVTGVYKSKLTETSSEDYSLDLFNENAIPHMVNLLLGHAMVSIGRGRRAAKLTELPIDLDTDALVSEGQELILSTIDAIKQDNNFYLALGD